MVILAGAAGDAAGMKIEECYRQMRYLRKLIFRSEVRSVIPDGASRSIPGV